MPARLHWPAWGAQAGWTVLTITLCWASGLVAATLIARRLSRSKASASHPWIHTGARAIGRHLPLWSALLGLWIAAGFWPLSSDIHALVGRGVFVVAALSVTLGIAGLATSIVDVYGPRLLPALPVTSLTRNLAWSVVALLGGLIILNGLGISITPMLTALGVGGLAVALALQEPLANFFAGLFITLAGQIRIGDYIALESGQAGYVVDFSWRSTRLRMLANNLIVVPNSKLAQATVVNHALPSEDLAVLVEVGVDYDSDLAHVERVVMDVGRQVMIDVAGGVPDFDPFIRYHTFGDSSVNFTTILRATHFVDQYLVKHEFVKRLHARFASEGIVIPFPIRTIHQADRVAAGR